ncbi:MAG TPA: lycopene cyclase domain-containing protein [Dermatophilaceae bacterium]|nr:lycopene cyclase domain-containing protein [Dermatophilaceae bacterium]
MSYTQLVLLAVPVTVLLDLGVLRTGLVRTRAWWAAYGIVLVFQLLTNGWLTGRGIVTYAPEAISGLRVAYAPVEDVGFGFALVLASTASWVRWGAPSSRPHDDGDSAVATTSARRARGTTTRPPKTS